MANPPYQHCKIDPSNGLQFDHEVPILSSILQKRSRASKYWQSRQFMLYDDCIVYGKDSHSMALGIIPLESIIYVTVVAHSANSSTLEELTMEQIAEQQLASSYTATEIPESHQSTSCRFDFLVQSNAMTHTFAMKADSPLLTSVWVRELRSLTKSGIAGRNKGQSWFSREGKFWKRVEEMIWRRYVKRRADECLQYLQTTLQPCRFTVPQNAKGISITSSGSSPLPSLLFTSVLSKRSPSLPYNYQARHFLLFPQVLVYFKNENDIMPAGCIHMANVRAAVAKDNKKLELVIEEETGGVRLMKLQADDQCTRDKWVSLLLEEMQLSSKIVNYLAVCSYGSNLSAPVSPASVSQQTYLSSTLPPSKRNFVYLNGSPISAMRDVDTTDWENGIKIICRARGVQGQHTIVYHSMENVIGCYSMHLSAPFSLLDAVEYISLDHAKIIAYTADQQSCTACISSTNERYAEILIFGDQSLVNRIDRDIGTLIRGGAPPSPSTLQGRPQTPIYTSSNGYTSALSPPASPYSREAGIPSLTTKKIDRSPIENTELNVRIQGKNGVQEINEYYTPQTPKTPGTPALEAPWNALSTLEQNALKHVRESITGNNVGKTKSNAGDPPGDSRELQKAEEIKLNASNVSSQSKLNSVEPTTANSSINQRRSVTQQKIEKEEAKSTESSSSTTDMFSELVAKAKARTSLSTPISNTPPAPPLALSSSSSSSLPPPPPPPLPPAPPSITSTAKSISSSSSSTLDMFSELVAKAKARASVSTPKSSISNVPPPPLPPAATSTFSIAPPPLPPSSTSAIPMPPPPPPSTSSEIPAPTPMAPGDIPCAPPM